MQQKDLHKFGKTDLLTLIYKQEKQIQQLKEEVEDLKHQLEDRTIQMKEAGSIAEASLKINKIFEVAQQAADEYLKSIKEVNKPSHECAQIEKDTTKDESKSESKNKADAKQFKHRIKRYRKKTKEKISKELVLVNNKIMGIKPKFLKRVVILLMFIAKEISFFMKKVKMNNKIIFIKLKRDVIKIIECIKLIYDKIEQHIKEFGDYCELQFSSTIRTVSYKIHVDKRRLRQVGTYWKKQIGVLKMKILNKIHHMRSINEKVHKKQIKKKMYLVQNLFSKVKEKKKIKEVEKQTHEAIVKNMEISIQDIEEELKKRKNRKEQIRFIKTLSYSAMVIIAFAIITSTSFFKILQVSGSSMEPNLHEGELLVTSSFFKFKKEDIIAFYYNDSVLIKRVIATEGDVINIEDDGTVFVNSVKLEENYVKDLAYGNCDITFPYQVPKNSVFILGDNREVSIDSRNKAIGCISKDKIIGKIKFKLNPFVIY